MELPTVFSPPTGVSVSTSLSSSPSQSRKFSPQSTARFFLDIFSGASMPVSAAVNDLFGDRIEPVDLIHGLDLLEDDTFESLLRLASSGRIGAALAAPYCCKHSRATLRPFGPAPVRTPEFLDGLPSNTTHQQIAVQESVIIHDRSRILLSAVDRHAGLVILENPSSSMTWEDRLMYDWVHAIAPFAAQACACQFDKDWAKAWMFVANRPGISFVARSCPHPSGTHEAIVGVRLPDSTFKSRLTAEYPAQLAQALAHIIRPYLTTGHPVLQVSEWHTILPKQLTWPQPLGRIEDGGGLPSSALQVAPLGHDRLATLRSKWFRRLSDSKQCLKITDALLSGCKEQPLSQHELKPYIDDMLAELDCPPGDVLLTYWILPRANHSGYSCGIAWQYFYRILMRNFCSSCQPVCA